MPETASAFEMIISLLPMVIVFILMYMFIIKPQKKKDEAILDMRNKLEVGDQVLTIGGLMGRIVAIRDDQITIETGADRIKLHFAKWAIHSKKEDSKE